jgi:hypothetical protein
VKILERGHKVISRINAPLPIDDIEVGMEVSYSQTITDADLKAYSGCV